MRGWWAESLGGQINPCWLLESAEVGGGHHDYGFQASEKGEEQVMCGLRSLWEFRMFNYLKKFQVAKFRIFLKLQLPPVSNEKFPDNNFFNVGSCQFWHPLPAAIWTMLLLWHQLPTTTLKMLLLILLIPVHRLMRMRFKLLLVHHELYKRDLTRSARAMLAIRTKSNHKVLPCQRGNRSALTFQIPT